MPKFNCPARVLDVTTEEFIRLLQGKVIRPASLDDVHGTHHKRSLFRHPTTRQFFVAVK